MKRENLENPIANASESPQEQVFDGFEKSDIVQVFFSLENGDADQVIDLLDTLDPKFHNIVAEKMIEKGYAKILAMTLDRFTGLGAKVAEKLAEENLLWLLGENLGSFANLTTEVALKFIPFANEALALHLKSFNNLSFKVAEFLIEDVYAEEVVKNLDCFSSLNYADLADKILQSVRPGVLADYFEKFVGLDPLLYADRILFAGAGGSLAANIEKFPGVDNQETAKRIIESHEGEALLQNLERFKNINQAHVFNLLAIYRTPSTYNDGDVEEVEDFGEQLANNLDKFNKLSGPEMAKKMIENGLGQYVARHLGKFKNIDYQRIADYLQLRFDTYYVAENIEEFKGIDPDAWAENALQKGELVSVMAFLQKFPKINHSNLFEKAIAFKREAQSVPQFFDNFKDLDCTDSAKKLIRAGAAAQVAENLANFKDIDQSDIADYMIDQGCSRALVANFNNFDTLDRNEFVLKIIKKGEGNAVAEYLYKYSEWSPAAAEKLVEAGFVRQVINNLGAFINLDKLSLAKKIIESKRAMELVDQFGKFQDLDNELLADLLIESGQQKILVGGLKKFKGLSQSILVKLLDFSYASICASQIKSFQHLTIDMAAERFTEDEFCSIIDNRDVFDFPPEVDVLIETRHFRTLEAVIYYLASPEEKAKKKTYEIFKDKDSLWQDNENILDPFRAGAEIFGEEQMFKYLSRKDLSRHDGLHQFRSIIKLYEESGLSAQEFYNNILQQVAHDNGEYYSGNAHHQLNSISQSFSSDFDKVKESVVRYQHIGKLKELFNEFESSSDIFSSWKMLKKYKEVQDLLNRTDIMDKLVELKQYPDKEKLRNYIETLAFHPNIAMDEVLSFWRTPADFLELADNHTSQEIHDRKKPSNYIEFPNLDLTAEELRDALVEGAYDSLQSFRPLTIEYNVGEPLPREPLSAALNRALGKRSENKKGEAKNPPKLFKELQKLCREKGISLPDILSSQAEVLSEDQKIISALLYAEDIGLSVAKGKTEAYRAKINKKSDPDAVVAGNDTACCMPFGSGKNNVYTFNPNCSLFTLQKRSGDGKWRTIAQSVLTEDVAISRNIPDIVKEVQDGQHHLNELMPDDILQRQKSFIACDNIEVAQAFKDKDEEIKILYHDFFKEYAARYAGSDNFEDSKIVIGKGYTDALTDLPQEENKFIPRAPVGYSDKLGDEVYTLDLQAELLSNVAIISKEVSEEAEMLPAVSDYLPRGVEPLTFRDALPVAYIEGKAYAENESLIEYLHNMENALIAKDVNNAAKQRPNLSFKYTGDDNKMHGYILAYEGRMHKQGENMVYVSDLASDGNGRAGGSLILGFTESYKRNYIDTGNVIPIYAQMRENTSYPIIKKQLDKLAQGTGIRFQMQEVRTYSQGGDMMHEVMISPADSNY